MSVSRFSRCTIAAVAAVAPLAWQLTVKGRCLVSKAWMGSARKRPGLTCSFVNQEGSALQPNLELEAAQGPPGLLWEL